MIKRSALSRCQRHGPKSSCRLGGEAGGRVGGDGGYALVFTALTLIPLMIFTASAVDLGAWYAQAARMQRAADAASLAGVVWLPTTSNAIAASNASLSRNWAGPGVSPQCGAGATCQVVNGTQWSVGVGVGAQLYFSKVINISNFSITRAATAAVNPPVPLGSPDSTYGNQLPGAPGCTDPAHNVPTAAACSGVNAGNVWATINGPYEHHQNGDPFSTRCWGEANTGDATASSCSNPASGSDLQTNPNPPSGSDAHNPFYKPDGYLYAVEVKTPGTVSVQVYDAAYDPRQNCTVGVNGGTATGPYPLGTWDPTCNRANNNDVAYPTSNRYETGDNAPGNLPGPTTEFQMYNFSGSAYQTNTTPANVMTGCSGGTGRIVAAPGTTAAPTVYKNRWVTLCTFNAPSRGIYPLRVRVDNIPGLCTFTSVTVADGCTGAGQNSFAFRANNAPAQIYAMENMDLYSNWTGNTSFYLADVKPVHKGKKVVLDMYDPGDGGCITGTACQFDLTVKGPDPATAGSLKDFGCNWTRSAYQGGPSNGLTGSPPTACTITTKTSTGSKFNNQWLRVTIQLPTNYTCPANNCWWKVVYNFNANPSSPGNPSDHTTWAFKIIGDPIHLVN